MSERDAEAALTQIGASVARVLMKETRVSPPFGLGGGIIIAEKDHRELGNIVVTALIEAGFTVGIDGYTFKL